MLGGCREFEKMVFMFFFFSFVKFPGPLCWEYFHKIWFSFFFSQLNLFWRGGMGRWKEYAILIKMPASQNATSYLPQYQKV